MTKLGHAHVLAITAAANKGAIPPLRTRLIAGFGADFLAHMLGAYSGQTIIVALAGLTKAAFSWLTGRRLLRVLRREVWFIRIWRRDIGDTDIGFGAIDNGCIRRSQIGATARYTAVGAARCKRTQTCTHSQ